jgi:hypothetical protein
MVFGDQTEKSIITIDIRPDGENSLTVEHSNIPEGDFADISEDGGNIILVQ